MSGWPPGCMTVPLRLGLDLVSPASCGRFRVPSVDGARLTWRRAHTSSPACRGSRGVGSRRPRRCRRRRTDPTERHRGARQHRRHDRVPRSRSQRRQRRLHQPPGAHRSRWHQGLPGQRDDDQRRLPGAHLHLGHHAADPRRAQRARGAHGDVARRRLHRRAVCRPAGQRWPTRCTRTRSSASTPTAARRAGGVFTSTIRRRRSTRRRPDPRCSSPASCATRCRRRASRRPAISARTACTGVRTWPG